MTISWRRQMIGINPDGIEALQGYRRRFLMSLYEQLRKDQAEYNRLCEAFDSGETNIELSNDLQRVMSWLDKEIRTIREARAGEIEGIAFKEIETLERDLEQRKAALRRDIWHQ